MTSERFRNPTDFERTLFEKLLSKEFLGKEEVRSQLQSVEVMDVDPFKSIQLRPVHNAKPAPVSGRIPVEASAADCDSVPIYLLLHVVNGMVAELQIYKADGSPIQVMPPAQAFQVT
jgi:hypothetical protein